ncbi:MAG: hypothetical protein U0W40_20595 [Acidimicrobiia bacterium]
MADDDGVAIIVPDAEVRGRRGHGGGIGDTASPFTVTVAVDEAQSRLVAAAVVSGGLSLARTTGATPGDRRRSRLGRHPVGSTVGGR